MANWQRHIYLNPEWEKAYENEISPQELAGVIAAMLKALTPFTGEFEDIEFKKDELVYEFEGMAADEDLTIEEFDGWMQELYDWGDMRLDDKWNGKKVCWIDTITARESA